MTPSAPSRTKVVVFSLVPLLALLLILEIVGRILYPFDPEGRAQVQTNRDPRLTLSYLGTPQVSAASIIHDLYRIDHRYLPFLGWIGQPNLDLPTMKTNELGFRDRPVEPPRPNERRILLLGGSTAWGLGASSTDATVAGALERLLNEGAPTGPVRVMNGAFSGWNSRQERVTLMELFDVFRPHLVITLTGYNDLMSMAVDAERAGAFVQRPESADLAKAVEANLRPMGTWQALRKVGGSLGIWRLVVYAREHASVWVPATTVTTYHPAVGRRESGRIADLYVSMAEFLRHRGGRLIVALQPDLYSTGKALTPEETAIKRRFHARATDIEPVFQRYRADLRRALLERPPPTLVVMDLQTVLDAHGQPLFIDDCHFNDRGYRIIAEALKTGIEPR